VVLAVVVMVVSTRALLERPAMAQQILVVEAVALVILQIFLVVQMVQHLEHIVVLVVKGLLLLDTT
jgi:hypothetical protein